MDFFPRPLPLSICGEVEGLLRRESSEARREAALTRPFQQPITDSPLPLAYATDLPAWTTHASFSHSQIGALRRGS